VSEKRQRELAAIEAEAMRAQYEPLPEGAVVSQPGLARSRVLQVRLNPEEYERVEREAARRGLPPSTLVRSWILEQLKEQPSVEDLASRVERLERAAGLE
jgi:predicted DNA-binding protein